MQTGSSSLGFQEEKFGLMPNQYLLHAAFLENGAQQQGFIAFCTGSF